MPEIGQTISHYRIVEKLGGGGMGIVYKGEDTKLHRFVALKFLPEIFASDPERMARFEREAKLLASLNHTNIASIHGLEEAAGNRFIVMELAEGETLASRIRGGPLPVDEALEVCRQIAEGLEAAHDKGIIHRDLKPSNVVVSQEGQVKILDFGLARALSGEVMVTDPSHSPTITETMTRPGVVLGTAAYMSPEQARGKPVDKRADIWAFGCILYECLTGIRAFQGETITETLASILKAEPDWHALESHVSWKVTDLARRCLQKDRNDRLHDIADARLEIAEAIRQPLIGEPVPSAKAHHAWRAIALTLALLALSMAAALVAERLRKPGALPVMRATIDLPPSMQLTRGELGPTRTELAVSPDGGFVVLSASADGSESKAKLYVRRMDSTEMTPIPGTEGARVPFISPDGHWVGFCAQGKLQKLPISGGIPTALCDLSAIPMGASWSPNARIIIGSALGGLQTVGAGGGKPENLTTLDAAKEATHRLPQFLPGGKAVLFTVMPFYTGTQARIEALLLDSGQRRVLIEDGADARFVPTGHLVYVRKGTLMAAPFDPDRLAIEGPSVPVLGNLLQAINETDSARNSGTGQFSFSQSGLLVYASGGVFPDPEYQLVWVDRRGKAETMAAFGKRPVFCPRLSPDGRTLAYATRGEDSNVWTYDLTRGTSSKLTVDGRVGFLSWTPDGARLVFGYSTGGLRNIFWMPSDGSGSIERLTTSHYNQHPGSWSPDGRFLALVENGPTGRDILYLQAGDQQAKPIMATKSEEAWPEFSPDGRWLAYSSDESGRWEVYVTAFPGAGRRIPVSSGGGQAPIWARNGRELLYWNLEMTKLMVAETATDPGFSAGTPRMLFEFRGSAGVPIRNYDISPDGLRFLIPQECERKPVEVIRLSVILNWFEELKRLVPAGKH